MSSEMCTAFIVSNNKKIQKYEATNIDYRGTY